MQGLPLTFSTTTGPSKVKVTVKGAAAVDPESELEDSHHVLETGGVIWNAVLNMVDITRGTNSYYKLQVLESDGGIMKRYCVFRSWGRVGTTIGGTKLEVDTVCACSFNHNSTKLDFTNLVLKLNQCCRSASTYIHIRAACSFKVCFCYE